MPKVLVIWANDTIPNLGVRALAAGSAALLRAAWPGADVRIHGTGPGAQGGNDGPMNIGHVPPLLKERVRGQRGLRDWLTSFDLVLDTRAGDSFADIYGFRRLAKMSVLPEFAHQWGVPVVMGPQTIGPFGSTGARAVARRSMRTAKLVIARDPESAVAAQELGRPVDLVSTDVVFALPRPAVARTRDVILNVSGLLWVDNPHVAHDDYRRLIVELVRELEAAGRTVSLLAHVASRADKSTDNDLFALEQLRPLLPGEHEELVPDSLDDARQLLGSAELVIGSRMHACLNALSMGTPVVPLAYSRKFAPLLEQLGWTTNVDLRTASDPLASTLREASRDDLADAVAHSVGRSDHLVDQAVDLLRGML